MRKQLFFLIIFALIIIFISGCALAVALDWIQPLDQVNTFLAVSGNWASKASTRNFIDVPVTDF
jgi:hypothetical protein